MTTNKKFHLLPVAAAMLAVYGNASAQNSAEVQELVTPSSSVSAGLANMNNDKNARKFGQWSGMSKGGGYGLFDIDLVKRDDATGTWMTLDGRDLGLDTRSLSFGQQKQGDWKYQLDYNEITKRDPYTIHTGLTGVGTTNPTVNLIAIPAMASGWAASNGVTFGGPAGSDLDLKIHRTSLGITASKWINEEFQFEASARTEEKKGARMFGRAGLDSSDMGLRPTIGTGSANGSWAVLLTPEPLSSKINTIEGKLSFHRDNFAISGGYYGSFYVNDFGSLNPVVPGTLNRGVLWNGGAGTPVAGLASSSVALPPDNQAHQIYLSGSYAYSKDTKLNFKASYTHATQHESFSGMGLSPAPGAPGDLGGVVNTTLVQGGLTSRVTKDLTVNASLRYEDRADRTPINTYNVSGTANALNGTTNWPSASQSRTTAKLEGIYRLPDGYSVVLGTDWEQKKTPPPPQYTGLFAGQSFFRDKLDEYGVHADARKALSETLNGSVGIEYKERRSNSPWQTVNGAYPFQIVPAGDPQFLSSVLPINFMDRNRAKAKATLDWAPADRMNIQAVFDHTQDNYNRAWDGMSRTGTPQPVLPGATDIYTDSLTLDGAYTVTDNWKVNAYWTKSANRWQVNKSGIADDTRDRQNTLGLGTKGKLSGNIDVGADLMFMTDKTTFNNEALVWVAGWVGQAGQPATFLPAIHQTTIRLKMFANYAVDKSSDVRLDVMYQHFRTDDWQWGYNGTPFLYSDNTTVSQNQNQKAVLVGARYVYKF